MPITKISLTRMANEPHGQFPDLHSRRSYPCVLFSLRLIPVLEVFERFNKRNLVINKLEIIKAFLFMCFLLVELAYSNDYLTTLGEVVRKNLFFDL